MSLKRLKNILPQSQLCSVYYGLVESHLRYGDVANWGSLNKTKKIARSWLNVDNGFHYDRNIMTYKIMSKFFPEIFFNKFLLRSSVLKYNTRHCRDRGRDLQISRYRTEFTKKDFITQP